MAAGLVAGVMSGLPSTVHAVATGRSPLDAARAAGALLGRPGLARGLVAHSAMSLWWSAVLRAVLQAVRSGVPAPFVVLAGGASGLLIGRLDLAIADRRFPEIARLPRWPQLADHVAFGVLVAATLAVRSRPAPARRAHAVTRRR